MMLRIGLLLAGGVLSAVGIAALALRTGDPDSAADKSRSSAAATTVANRARTEVHGVGYVEPVSEIRRLMFKAGGVIETCRAEVGCNFAQGEILMRLSSREEEAAVAVAEAEVQLAQAEYQRVISGVHPARIVSAQREMDLAQGRLAFAKKSFERANGLRKGDAVSEQSLDDFENLFRQAERGVEVRQAELDHLRQFVRTEDVQAAAAAVKLTDARLAAARRRLEYMELKAPCAGTVLEILMREGEGVQVLQPQPVILFADVSRLRVRAEIDERNIHRLAAGQQVIVSSKALGDATFDGRVELVKQIMGKKTLFSGSSAERKDLDVLQVLIDMNPGFRQPIGLRVDVTIQVSASKDQKH